ncbi:MAG: hypothetical protein UY07_C0008G0006 [Parcubacteria group bacterium GW2011_GWA1_47_8]|nr:MAG: hypothetical protein UY07_C0008G0006 [Parcubacteria group bacterium GW2011_GWA1_47_8]
MKKEVIKKVTIDDLSVMVVKENLATTRRDVLEIGDRFVPRYEIHDLLVRFDKLERQVKGK